MERNPPVNPPSYKADSAYYWDFVTFLVEDTLFRVPRYNLVAQSESFSTKYGIGKDTSESTGLIAITDYSPANLVQLDVTISDFRAFLKVLYPMVSFPKYEVDPKPAKPTPFQVEPSLTTTEWISVLKLSTQWHFNEVRAMAIKALSKSSMDCVQKASLAKEFYVKKWLLSAYRDLVKRSDPISVDEAEKLGWKNAILLFQIREKDRESPQSSSARMLMKGKIKEAFATDFSRIRLAQPKYQTAVAKEVAGRAFGKGNDAEDLTDTEDEGTKTITKRGDSHGFPFGTPKSSSGSSSIFALPSSKTSAPAFSFSGW